jgi:hypothetical protein
MAWIYLMLSDLNKAYNVHGLVFEIRVERDITGAAGLRYPVIHGAVT